MEKHRQNRSQYQLNSTAEKRMKTFDKRNTKQSHAQRDLDIEKNSN